MILKMILMILPIFINKNGVTMSNNRLEMLSKSELASELNVSGVTINNWMNKGMPYYKFSGRVFFKLDEVLTYARKQAI